MTEDKVLVTKFEDITCFRSKHNVLTSPLTDDELNQIATKRGKLKVKVRISMSELIWADDMEGFNQIIDDKVVVGEGTLILSDMSYKAVGTKDGDVIVRVEAQLEEM